nr:DUF4384 domain-containing protein [Prevotella sp.]
MVFTLTLLVALPLSAQRTEKVSATYTYVAPENLTVAQAKEIALDRAKNEAIADKFGTLINQSNSTLMSNADGKSMVDFYSLSSSDVKGEWIETIGEPKYEVSYDKDMLVVKVSVEGRAREIVSAGVNLDVKLMRTIAGGKKAASTDFQNGDDLFLQFSSPVSGYLAVYLLDKKTAYCLLPYMRDESGKVMVKANRKYLFFSPADALPEEKTLVDEYTMTCENNAETDKVYVIFSPNMFTKANDNVGSVVDGLTLPRELTYEEFNKWLSKNRLHDDKMTVVMQNITIRK